MIILGLLRGIFSTKNKAEIACKNEFYFITPVYLNEELSIELTEFEEQIHPKYQENSYEKRS